MLLTKLAKQSQSIRQLIDNIHSRKDDIERWLQSLEGGKEFPLYSSMDIRDAGFKMGVIDTNLFPAGFNNLCEHGLNVAIVLFHEAILKRVKNCKNILIVIEEHTRNVWYLENVRVLQEIITKAGFTVRIATYLTFQPDFCDKVKFLELETATGKNLRVNCFQAMMDAYEAGREKFDLIILNNDLINGIPDSLKKCEIPICPPVEVGWHARLKSNHFKFTLDILREFSELVPLDLWLVSALYEVVDEVNINNEHDRLRIFNAAEKLLVEIQKKYVEHGITEKPYVVIKADAGTYGMGILAIEDISHIKDLSSKERNKLFKGKGGEEIHRYLIQEGIPTIYEVDHKASEVCLYQVEQNYVGSFFRTNSIKGARENLNANGMEFHKICSFPEHQEDVEVFLEDDMFDVYRILCRIAAIAAHREILQLKAEVK